MTLFSNIQRMMACPHFDNCNTVKCPLDEFMQRRVKLPEDREKCRLGKIKRVKLSGDMPTFGLDCYEIAAIIRCHGSLEKGIRAILRKNFTMKNKTKFFKSQTIFLGKNKPKPKGKLRGV